MADNNTEVAADNKPADTGEAKQEENIAANADGKLTINIP